MCVYAYIGQERALDVLKLEIGVVGSHSMWCSEQNSGVMEEMHALLATDPENLKKLRNS